MREMKIARSLSVTLLILLLTPLAGLSQNTKENADFKLAVNLYTDGLFDLAAEQLKQFIDTYPSTAQGIDARFYLGLTQLKLKKYDDARLTFQTFALTYQDNPKAPEAWWNVGEAYASMRDYRNAALAFERVNVFHPKYRSAPDALLRASDYFFRTGQEDDSRRVLRAILQEYPTSAPVLQARTNLARLYFKEGNLDQAQNELKRVVEGDPSPEAKAQSLLLLGNIYQTTGRNDQAEANYLDILKRYASTTAAAGAHLSLGKLQASAGKAQEAIDNFRKVTAGKPGRDSLFVREALMGMGDAYVSLKDFPNAITAYDKFLSTVPGDSTSFEVLWKIAVAASKEKQYRRSNDACNRILKSTSIESLKKRALIRLAFNATDQNAAAQAVQYLNRYIEQYADDPATPEVLFRMASIAEKQLNDERKAAVWYEMLTNRQSPLADDALMGEARCYERLREPSRALETYRELVDKYPASDFRAEADRRLTTIETFEATDKDAGLEKLAVLVGDLVSQHDRASLSFRLGRIYFGDLKNYQAAALQFTNALEGGIADSLSAEALFHRSRSYDYLSCSDESYRPKAIAGYELFRARYPSDPRVREAALSLFRLRATSLAAARNAYDSLSAAFSQPADRAGVLLTLARLQESADSTAAALATLSQVLSADPSSASAEEAAYRRIMLLQKIGLKDQALQEARAYLAAFSSGPHAPAVLMSAAGLSLKNGNPAGAAEFYQQLVNEFWYTRTAAEANRELADADVSAGNYTAAISIYLPMYHEITESPVSAGGPEPSLLLAIANAYHLSGEPAEAKKFLFSILSREHTGPIAGQAYQMLGAIAREAGSLDDAASYFRQAEAAAPGSGTSRDIANLLFDRGDYPAAIRTYSQLLSDTTSVSDRRFYEERIIVCRLRADGPASVEKQIAAFAKSFPDADTEMAAFSLEAGTYAFSKEDYARASRAFSEVIKKYDETPSAPAAAYWIAKTLEATGKPQEAVKELESLIQEHPASDVIPRAYLTLGNIWYNAERWDEAIKDYRQVVDNPHPDSSLLPLGMSNLIETYDAAAAYDAALALTRKYLEQYPNAEDALDKKIKIGILYDKLGFFDQAVLQLQSLLDEAGSDLEGELRYYIAEANYNKGNYQQAILDFLKVPYLVTKKGKIDWTANSLYMAGQSYEKMGRYDDALTMYQQILDRTGIDPTYKTAAKKEIDRVKLVVKQKPG